MRLRAAWGGCCANGHIASVPSVVKGAVGDDHKAGIDALDNGCDYVILYKEEHFPSACARTNPMVHGVDIACTTG